MVVYGNDLGSEWERGQTIPSSASGEEKEPGWTHLAVVQNVGTVKVMDIELFGHVGDKVVYFPFDTALDRVQQRRMRAGGVQCEAAKHRRVELYGQYH